MLEKDDFPLMREFVNAREYMQELVDNRETVGDDLFDMFV